MDQLYHPFLITLWSCGLIFYIVGRIMLAYPPKKISHLYGYRTPGSMKSQERWDFAQAYSSRLIVNLGAVLVVLGSLSLFFDIPEEAGAIVATGMVVAAAVFLIVRTETELNRQFTDEEE